MGCLIEKYTILIFSVILLITVGTELAGFLIKVTGISMNLWFCIFYSTRKVRSNSTDAKSMKFFFFEIKISQKIFFLPWINNGKQNLSLLCVIKFMHERILSSEKFIFEKAEHVNFLNIFTTMILDFLNFHLYVIINLAFHSSFYLYKILILHDWLVSLLNAFNWLDCLINVTR